MSFILHEGKLEDVLPTLAADSIDSCVTDTPYHLTANKKGGSGIASLNVNSPAGRARIRTGFMGMGWDGGNVAFRVETWLAVFRVLKPGAHLLAFGGTRTHHRLVCAIEDAGFEIRDEVDWIFGQGFPKSLNLEDDWDGWGTALKPAKEPICLARKPLIGTVEANISAHGVGAINIDGCRIPFANDSDREKAHENALGPVERFKTTKPIFEGGKQNGGFADTHSPKGRWPANVMHDGSQEVMSQFPDTQPSKGAYIRKTGEEQFLGQMGDGRINEADGLCDSGSAGRFFYCPKATKLDRDDGCEALLEKSAADCVLRESGTAGMNSPRAGAGRTSGRKNFHPTVKPTALMRYLCRLVTPPGGTVIDPFMGSGSTGRGAVLEGFNFVGIEMTPEYLPIARARITKAEADKLIEDQEQKSANTQTNLPL